MQQPKTSSTFGIIAIVISIIAFYTPRFMVSMVLIALTVLIILGFVRDKNKLFSGIAVAISLLLLFAMYQQGVQADRKEAFEAKRANALYWVRYEVICPECDVRYTNETGGTNGEKDVSITWSDSLEIKGSQFVQLSAQNGRYGGTATVNLYVDDSLVATEQSRGEYKIASVSYTPKDIYGE